MFKPKCLPIYCHYNKSLEISWIFTNFLNNDFTSASLMIGSCQFFPSLPCYAREKRESIGHSLPSLHPILILILDFNRSTTVVTHICKERYSAALCLWRLVCCFRFRNYVQHKTPALLFLRAHTST